MPTGEIATTIREVIIAMLQMYIYIRVQLSTDVQNSMFHIRDLICLSGIIVVTNSEIIVIRIYVCIIVYMCIYISTHFFIMVV